MKRLFLLLALAAATPVGLLAAALPGAPELSTSDAPKWYHLQFPNNSRVITAGAKDSAVTQSVLGVTSNQLFRIEGNSYDSIKVISKINNLELKHELSGNTFVLVASGEGDSFSLISYSDDASGGKQWQLKDNDSYEYEVSKCFVHPNGNAGVTVYYASDAKSTLRFIDELSYTNFPALSSAADPKWYYLKNSRSGKVIMHSGAGAQVRPEELAEGGVKPDSQLFRLEGATHEGGVTVVSKAGGVLQVSDGNVLVAESNGSTFLFAPAYHATYGGNKWGMKYKDDELKGLHVSGSNVIVYNITDDGNVFELIPARQLTATVTNPTKGSVSPTEGFYADGSAASVAVTAAPEPYNRLISWAIDGEASPETGDTLKLSLTFDRDISVAATFVGIDTLLGSLALTGDVSPLIPAFDPNTSSYIVRAFPGVQAVTVAATARSSESTVTGAGEKLLTGSDTTFYLTVTAEDGVAKKTYSVDVRWADPNASNDVSLTLSLNGEAATSLTADTTTFSVPANAVTATIAATVADSATILSSPGTEITLAGENTAFSITVLAANYTDSKTYTVIVHRLSSDATLKELTLAAQGGGAITLSPAFSAGREEYTASTSSAAVTVAAAANHSAAAVAYTPANGTLSLLAGATGSVSITVTAEDGSTKTYQVTVTRENEVQSAVEAVALGKLTIYPNPAAGGEVKIVNGPLKAGERIEIHSLSGTLVAAYEIAAGAETAINISRLPQGVYIVKAGAYAAKLINN
jgi:hypothetical protein